MLLLRFGWYILITAYVFFSPYYLLTKHHSQSYSPADRLLGAFTLGIAQIIITEASLGLALILNSLNLFIFNLALSTGILLYAGLSRRELSRQLEEAKQTLAGVFNLVLRQKTLGVISALAVLQTGWWAFLVYLFPPYAWDALAFHLPKVTCILQSHGIEVFPALPIFINTYPFNAELLFLWNVIYLGNDIIVDGTQAVFALCGALAIYSIARKTGVKPQNAGYALIFLFIPIVIQQATTCYIDIIVSVMLITAVNFMLLKDRDRINLIILGAMVGMMLGTKYSYILPGLIVSLAALFLIVRDRKRGQSVSGRKPAFSRKLLADGLFYIIPILVLGGSWYGRNYLLFNNPLAPIEINFLGRTISPGPIIPEGYALNAPVLFDAPTVFKVWLERESPSPFWDESYYTLGTGKGGFGPLFFILLLPSLLFSFYLIYKKRLGDYLAVAAVFVLAFLTIPMDWWTRYTVFFSGFGVLSFTVVMEHLPRAKTMALMAAPLVILTMVLGNYHVYFTPERILDFIQRPLSERQSADFIIYFEKFAEPYQIVSARPETTILYTVLPNGFSYPFWGSSFANRVINIPENYESYGEFIKYIRGFGPCQIVTTGDSAIARYVAGNQPNLQLVYQKDEWRIITYDGGE